MTKALAMQEHVGALWRPPFSDKRPVLHLFKPGKSIAEMVAETPGLPPDFAKRGEVLLGEAPLVRRFWSRIRLKPGKRVTFHYPLAGGGGNGSSGRKSILSLVVSIAALVASVAVLGGAAAGLFGAAFKAGTIGARLLAGGISVVGALAAGALTPPPVAQGKSRLDQTKGPASLSGNVLGAGAPIPAVIGTRRVFPPLACQPLVERLNGDEIVEAIFVLAGAHDISDIRVGDAAIEDANDIAYEVKNGFGDDERIDLVQRYGITKTPQIELSRHKVTADDQSILSDQNNPANSIPVWHSVRTSVQAADEVWLHFSLAEGLGATSGSTRYGIPIRLRMRTPGGASWINLPEMHYWSNDHKEIRLSVRLVWGSAPESVASIPANEGWTIAYKHVDGQSAPASDAWDADSSFSNGSGSDGLYNSVEASSKVKRIALGRWEATVYLDPNVVTPGAYEIEVKRGCAYQTNNWSKPNYTYSGTHDDPFYYVLSGSTAKVDETLDGVLDRLFLLRISSVINSHPMPTPGKLAAIAIKATNRSVDSLSCLASRYVYDWDGSGWNTFTTTDNPAPHLRDMWVGGLTPDALPLDLLDDTSLVDWRSACVTAGYSCNLVVEGENLTDVEDKVTGCGYARARKSETWGVIRDYDRSADDPLQVFTQRNSAGLQMAKAFPRLPDAFRVTWYDAALDDAEQQTIVWRPTVTDEEKANPRIEEVTYDGLDNETDATARALFDLRQAELRAATWSFSAPAEALRTRRGDLIGVNHDTISKTNTSARIISVQDDGTNVTGITLDCAVPIYDEPGWFETTDFFAVTDIFDMGLKSSVGVRQSDGSFTVHALSNSAGSTDALTFTTPVAIAADPDDGDPVIRAGNLVYVGQAGKEVRRLIINSITYDKDMAASIEAVDEAPELWAA